MWFVFQFRCRPGFTSMSSSTSVRYVFRRVSGTRGSQLNSSRFCRNPFCINYSWMQKRSSSHASSSISPAINQWAQERIGPFVQFYEDFLGLTEVRNAQQKVIDAEREFIHAQQTRREYHRRLADIEAKLKEIRAELDRTARAEDKYLSLVTQEHKLVKEEKGLQHELEEKESSERGTFSLLSAAVRESHEKERARAERTKYWSLVGSVIGAAIGILGTSLNNWLRMRDLKTLVTTATMTNALPMENLSAELSSLAKTQNAQLESFVTDLKKLLGEQVPNLPSGSLVPKSDSSKDVLEVMREQSAALTKEMQLVKDLIIARRGGADPNASEVVVYVKNDLEEALAKAGENMEWKLKINSIVTAAFLYTAIALSVPVIYYLFGQR